LSGPGALSPHLVVVADQQSGRLPRATVAEPWLKSGEPVRLQSGQQAKKADDYSNGPIGRPFSFERLRLFGGPQR